MDLNPELCYRVILSRDARFDGRFFAAVLTTGIYCRCVCPAPKPRMKNVVFYRTAASAEQAGFRPCLRCRPEMAPATPPGSMQSEITIRALNLIDAGFLDDHPVTELAAQVQMSERHLRRLFKEQLGTSPGSVAFTRRLHVARKLLSETHLSITDIAFGSGFSSLSRFNSAFKRAYDVPPSRLRKPTAARLNPDSNIQLKLAYRPPFHWDHLLGFLQARSITNVEWVIDDRYYRTISFDGRNGILQVANIPEHHCVVLTIPAFLSRSILQIVESVKRIFDLRADPSAIQNVIENDPALAPIVNQLPGIRIPGCWNWFELAVRAILGQQVTVKAACKLASRLVDRCHLAVNGIENSDRLFPTPEHILSSSLTGLGIPAVRIKAIQDLARAAVEREIGPDCGIPLHENLNRLCRIPGIGRWTAHYIALRAFKEPDIFLPGDVALRRAASRLYGKHFTALELLKHAERWRPWRSYAVLYLWAEMSFMRRNG